MYYTLNSGRAFEELPLEIIQKVFVYAQSPVLITHICHKWRNFAHNWPELWDSVTLAANVKRPFQDNIARFNDILALWSRCSSQRPFYLKIAWNGHPTGLQPDDEEYRTLPLPANICYLEIQGNDVQLVTAALPPGTKRFDFLKALRIVDENLSNTGTGFSPTLLPAPNFHMLSLSIKAATLLLTPEWGNLPWDQMTHICIERDMGLRVWHMMLRSCPRLEKCYVDFHFHAESNDHLEEVELLEPTVLHHLKELEIGFSSDFFPSIFSGLCTPALQELYLENHPSIPGELGFLTTAPTTAFLYEAAKNLMCLRLIHQHNIDADEVVKILRLTKCLTILQINVEGDHDRLLNALCTGLEAPGDVPGDTQVLASRLVSCDIYINKYGRRSEASRPYFSAEAYCRAILSRWVRWRTLAAGSTLKRADFAFRWVLLADSDHLDAIAKVKDTLAVAVRCGLKLTIGVKRAQAFWTYADNSTEAWLAWKLQHNIPVI
ncbi:hypothetical protein DXG01_008079 [Tephrocybe rancida]|nr:hypothetical protein DXG01_008079 [Tephrocybe rancida]